MRKKSVLLFHILIVLVILCLSLAACDDNYTVPFEECITFNVLDLSGESIVNVVLSGNTTYDHIGVAQSKEIEIKGGFDFNSVNDNNSKSKFYLCKDFLSFNKELGTEYKDYVELSYSYANINEYYNNYGDIVWFASQWEWWTKFVRNKTLYLRCHYYIADISYYISEQEVEYLTIYEIVGVDDEGTEIREYTHLPVIIQKTKKIFMGFYDEKDGEGIKYVDSKCEWIETPVSNLILYPYYMIKPNRIYLLDANHEQSLLSESVGDEMPNLPQVKDILGWYIAGTNIKIADANGIYRPGYESIDNDEYQSAVIEQDEACVLTLECRYE